jgi:hypothetical protein
LLGGGRMLPYGCRTVVIVLSIVLLAACGGSGGDESSFNPSSANPTSAGNSTSSRSVGNSSLAAINLSGRITYDFVPHNTNHIGLNHAATEMRPVRGATIQLLDAANQIVAAGSTNASGDYSFSIAANQMLRIRVKAELSNNQSPSWNFRVTDNTSGNSIYVMDGSLASTGAQNSTRDLHAASGWDGTAYRLPRVAAPFAILDAIYMGNQRVLEAGNYRNLPPLELRWSTKNLAASGDVTKGEIETSSYDGTAIYILGDANSDSDEYDGHVLLHEWSHYLEANLFRSDSLGGDHNDGQILDMRVAMSEGLANAFSAMMLENPNYADASGAGQASGFTFNVSRRSRVNKGYFSEGSVGSVLFNYYSSSHNKVPNDFTPIFQLLSHPDYYNSEAFTSIFLFLAQMKARLPEQVALFSSILGEQNINGTDEFASGETNDAGSVWALPVYKVVNPDNAPINLCSSAEFGKPNKLTNAQLARLSIGQSGAYILSATKASGDNVTSKPEIILYRAGLPLFYVKNVANDTVSGSVNLSPGNYLIEVYDLNNRDETNTSTNTTCFNLRIR